MLVCYCRQSAQFPVPTECPATKQVTTERLVKTGKRRKKPEYLIDFAAARWLPRDGVAAAAVVFVAFDATEVFLAAAFLGLFTGLFFVGDFLRLFAGLFFLFLAFFLAPPISKSLSSPSSSPASPPNSSPLLPSSLSTNCSRVYTSFADPNPESGAFLTPGSRIRDEHPGSYFREL